MSCKMRLKVQRIHQTCLFELSWGNGRQLSCTLSYPESLSASYQEWQRVYLSFYKSAQMPLPPSTQTTPQTSMRGRVEASGDIASQPIDWHARLVQAEGRLLCEFHHWLRSAELFEIRSRIALAASGRMNDEAGKMNSSSCKVDLFITCHPIELERLPWETWEIGAEFAAFGAIRIARTPANIRLETSQTRRRKARVLAILGDDTGLDFQADRLAVRSLSRIAHVDFVGWQPGQDVAQVKANICAALADQRGWDVLFFAGHSNETALADGELGIAPGASMSINEIAPQLQAAKSRGLQFALFNSCSGINIAESLIDLGLSQVAVMREPVHNRVAQEFLVRFLQVLAEFKDVHEAMLAACQYLKLEKNLTYPSASLVPSLFCHPDAVPFRIKPIGIREQLKKLLPTPMEAIAVSALLLTGWQLWVQDFLLAQRVLIQAVYRQVTHQIPGGQPPVLLVQIDNQSIQKAKISNPKPMDRNYLASLVDRLKALDARVVGIDYLFDRPQSEKDARLAQSLQAAVSGPPQPTWFVFAKDRDENGGWMEPLPEIASPNWSLHGHIRLLYWYVELVPRNNPAGDRLPFAYLLALAHQLNQETLSGSATMPQPKLDSQTDFLAQVTSYLSQTQRKDYRTLFSPQSRLQPITAFSYRLGQMWMHPIVDFSIPPERVYKRIPAMQLLRDDSSVETESMSFIKQQVVIIAAGGYGEAGVSKEGEDNFPLPDAVGYWRSSAHPVDPRRIFTGGEAHAYMVHHLLNQRLVVPIPDLWAIGVAAILGKATALAISRRLARAPLRYHQGRRLLLVIFSTTAVYGLVSLQVYISGAILLPWVLPSVTVWTFAIPAILNKKFYG